MARATEITFDPPATSDVRAMRAVLAQWFRETQRDLPWRRTRDPYGIWISEAMLQQTRVEVVLDYWPRFLDAFPTVEALAEAPEERVLEVWSGLGYYRRARSLQAAARELVTRFGGEFPRTRAEAESLPGIGPYTAGAVLSIAHDLPEAIVDGNVERVLSRLFRLDGVRSSAPLQRAAWAVARRLVEAGHGDGVAPRVWSQALMELGALVCKPKRPLCAGCPLASRCAARAAGIEADLPRPRPKKAVLDVALEVYVVRRGADLVLTQRPDDGRMGGLWEFPTVEVTGHGLFPGEVAGALGRALEPGHDLFEITHGITHHRIRARVRSARAGALESSPSGGLVVASAGVLSGLAVTGMTRKILGRLDSEPQGLFAGT